MLHAVSQLERGLRLNPGGEATQASTLFARGQPMFGKLIFGKQHECARANGLVIAMALSTCRRHSQGRRKQVRCVMATSKSLATVDPPLDDGEDAAGQPAEEIFRC